MFKKFSNISIKYWDVDEGIKGVDKFIPKAKGTFLCAIGHELDGTFNRDHIDFETFGGLFHTEKAIIWYCLSALLLWLCTSGIYIAFKIYYMLPLQVCVALPMLLWFTYAVIKKSHRMMLPYLILAILYILFGLIIEILLAITVVKPHLPVAQFMMKVCYTDMMEWQMVILLVITIGAIEVFAWMYITWCMYFHYVWVYHINTGSCCHHRREECDVEDSGEIRTKKHQHSYKHIHV